MVKHLPTMWETRVHSLGREDLLENEMATHSSILDWNEPGRLQSMGSQRVGHDWATSLSLFTFMHWRRKWQPIPVFLPGEFPGLGSLVGCHLWGHTELGHGWSDLAVAAAKLNTEHYMHTLIFFPQNCHNISIPSSNVAKFQLSHISVIWYYHFNFSHWSPWALVSHCGFNLFP